MYLLGVLLLITAYNFSPFRFRPAGATMEYVELLFFHRSFSTTPVSGGRRACGVRCSWTVPMSLSAPARAFASAAARHDRSRRRSPRGIGTDKRQTNRVRIGTCEVPCRVSSIAACTAGVGGDTSVVRSFLRDRTIVLTGSTGFLAKVFLEKLLWEQPDVRCVYLIISPRGTNDARVRLEKEIIALPLFDRLRERHGGKGFDAFIQAKLVPVPGDLGVDGVGLSPSDFEKITETAEIVVHSAASTKFNERFDVAVNVNALGPKRMLDLAKQCGKLKVMMHVSTAFVNGLRVGDQAETAFRVGDSIANELSCRIDSFGKKYADDDDAGLDPYAEIDLAFSAARDENNLAASPQSSSHVETSSKESRKDLTQRLVALGTARAKRFGWQDTYVFTKAMGEQILSHEKHQVPIVIVRPSIVEGALHEPFPGWIEGVRMADPLILAYGKGLISGFVGDEKGVLDIVPVDSVVNVMLAALVKEGSKESSKESSGDTDRSSKIPVYHAATSTMNPLNFCVFLQIVKLYFVGAPLLEKKSGAPIIPPRNVSVFKSRKLFELDTWLRQDGARVTGTSLLERIKPGSITNAQNRKNQIAKKTWTQLRDMGQLYEPYTAYAARFGSANVKELRDAMADEDRELFPFEFETLDWQKYLSEIHIPGLLKHALRVGVVPGDVKLTNTTQKAVLEESKTSDDVMSPIVAEKA